MLSYNTTGERIKLLPLSHVSNDIYTANNPIYFIYNINWQVHGLYRNIVIRVNFMHWCEMNRLTVQLLASINYQFTWTEQKCIILPCINRMQKVSVTLIREPLAPSYALFVSVLQQFSKTRNSVIWNYPYIYEFFIWKWKQAEWKLGRMSQKTIKWTFRFWFILKLTGRRTPSYIFVHDYGYISYGWHLW